MAEEKQSTSIQGPPLNTGGPPPPAAYQQQSLGGTATVVVSETVSALNQVHFGGPVHSFGEHSTRMTCPLCNTDVTTSTTYVTGTLTWLVAGFILMLGLWLGCCLIPFCIDGCKDVEHTCPNCRQLIGTHKKL